MLFILSLDLSNKYNLSIVTYVDRNKRHFLYYLNIGENKLGGAMPLPLQRGPTYDPDC